MLYRYLVTSNYRMAPACTYAPMISWDSEQADQNVNMEEDKSNKHDISGHLRKTGKLVVLL